MSTTVQNQTANTSTEVTQNHSSNDRVLAMFNAVQLIPANQNTNIEEKSSITFPIGETQCTATGSSNCQEGTEPGQQNEVMETSHQPNHVNENNQLNKDTEVTETASVSPIVETRRHRPTARQAALARNPKTAARFRERQARLNAVIGAERRELPRKWPDDFKLIPNLATRTQAAYDKAAAQSPMLKHPSVSFIRVVGKGVRTRNYRIQRSHVVHAMGVGMDGKVTIDASKIKTYFCPLFVPDFEYKWPNCFGPPTRPANLEN